MPRTKGAKNKAKADTPTKKTRLEEPPKPPAPPKLQLKLALSALECTTCSWSPILTDDNKLTCPNPNCPTKGSSMPIPKVS